MTADFVAPCNQLRPSLLLSFFSVIHNESVSPASLQDGCYSSIHNVEFPERKGEKRRKSKRRPIAECLSHVLLRDFLNKTTQNLLLSTWPELNISPTWKRNLKNVILAILNKIRDLSWRRKNRMKMLLAATIPWHNHVIFVLNLGLGWSKSENDFRDNFNEFPKWGHLLVNI